MPLRVRVCVSEKPDKHKSFIFSNADAIIEFITVQKVFHPHVCYAIKASLNKGEREREREEKYTVLHNYINCIARQGINSFIKTKIIFANSSFAN